MKLRTVLFLLILATASGWFAREHAPFPKPDVEEKTEPETGVRVPEPGHVKLDADSVARLGIGVSPLSVREWTPGVEALGAVLDPAPLVALVQEIESASALVTAARIELDRATSLFQSGQNVARKSVDSAQAQVQTGELKLNALKSRLTLEWGTLCQGMDEPNLHRFSENLVLRKSVVIRVEATEEVQGIGPASTAEATVLGRALVVERLIPAPTVNDRTLALAFLLLGRPASALPNGASVSARLLSGSAAQAGTEVPSGAVIRQGAQAWVYLEKQAGEYQRFPIQLSQRTPAGWFLPAGTSLKPGAQIVTTGAAALLSTELVSAGLGSSEEE